METFAFKCGLYADHIGESRSFLPGSVTNIESVEKNTAIRELLCKSKVFSRLPNRDAIEDAVLAREKLMSTAIGRGMAVAHGKTNAVNRTLVALGVSRAGIRFDSPHGKPVNFLFIVANPPSLCDEYLKILSTIARIGEDSLLRAELLDTTGIADIDEIVSGAFSYCLSESSVLLRTN
jgi:nitrogen PTS system EIIA component